MYYRRNYRKNLRHSKKTRSKTTNQKRKYRSKTRIKRNYRTHAKKPILGYRFWDEVFKFERKWGVMRRGKGWPRH